MDNQDLKSFRGTERAFFKAFIVVFTVLLVALTLFTLVSIQNKIKEGKYIGQEIETKNTITVSDSGEIFAKPDLAIVIFSVVNEAKTVAKAMEENSEKMNAVINSMKNKGIEEKDLKTISFNIYPRYEWHEKSTVPPYSEGERVLVGYEVHQSLQVKMRDMTKIGEIIEGATAAGANEVGDLQFTIDKEEELKKEARKQAIEKAKVKAKELASQLGVNLVRITNFQESSEVPMYYGLERAVGLGGGEEVPQPQIETGENKIEVTVSITYEIN